MQLTATKITPRPIQLRPPHSARPGMPTTQSVLLTSAPTITPFPDRGFGVQGTLMQFGTSGLADARTMARDFAESTNSAYAVIAHARRAGDAPSYSVAQLVALDWQQQGYGGHFRETAARLGNVANLHAISKNGATVLAVFAGARELTVTRSW